MHNKYQCLTGLNCLFLSLFLLSRNSQMTILGIFNWNFISMLLERENPENEWFKQDGWGFVTFLKDCIMHKQNIGLYWVILGYIG